MTTRPRHPRGLFCARHTAGTSAGGPAHPGARHSSHTPASGSRVLLPLPTRMQRHRHHAVSCVPAMTTTHPANSRRADSGGLRAHPAPSPERRATPLRACASTRNDRAPSPHAAGAPRQRAGASLRLAEAPLHHAASPLQVSGASRRVMGATLHPAAAPLHVAAVPLQLAATSLRMGVAPLRFAATPPAPRTPSSWSPSTVPSSIGTCP